MSVWTNYVKMVQERDELPYCDAIQKAKLEYPRKYPQRSPEPSTHRGKPKGRARTLNTTKRLRALRLLEKWILKEKPAYMRDNGKFTDKETKAEFIRLFQEEKDRIEEYLKIPVEDEWYIGIDAFMRRPKQTRVRRSKREIQFAKEVELEQELEE